MNVELYRAARAYIERLDLSLVVAFNNKIPNTAFFPHGVKDATKDLELIEQALRATPNATLAARVAQHLVVDADVRSGAVETLAKALMAWGNFPRSWSAETPTGGVHYWFRPVDFFVRGHVLGTVELLRGNRLVTLSPSRRAGGRYRWGQSPLDTELAEAPHWLKTLARAPEMQKAPERDDAEDTPEEREARASAYMQHFAGALSGSKGHARTMAAAVIVVRGFWLDDVAALRVMREWNHFCQPCWPEFDLKRKIADARQCGRMAWGEMLRKERAA